MSRECPLDIMPLYVRAGSIVPFGPAVQHVMENPDAPFEIRIYPGRDAKFTIYEDDNETYVYERGRALPMSYRGTMRLAASRSVSGRGHFPV